MTFDPNIIMFSLVGVVVLLLLWIIRLEVKLHRLTRGKNGGSLEDVISDLHKKLDTLLEFRGNALAYFTDIEKRLLRSVQSVRTMRFNPFKGSGEGGNQSFSTAFVSEEGDGVVLSSLYSRDRVSIFSKPLERWKSTFELTDEEKETLAEAKRTISKQ